MKSNLKWGDKVVTTQKAINKNIFPQHRGGICLSNRGWFITVVCKGQTTPRKYHPSFWKKNN